MRIEDIDRNLRVETGVSEPDLVWLDAREEPFSIHGMFYDEAQGCFVRMEQSVADRVSDGVRWLNRHTSGGRVRFKTDSPYIAIRAEIGDGGPPPAQIPLAGNSGFDMYLKAEGMSRPYQCYAFTPPHSVAGSFSEGYGAELEGEVEYTVHFPIGVTVTGFFVGLKKGISVVRAEPYRGTSPVVYYGSSITQGHSASLPGQAYEAVVATRTGYDFINLGFSGCCRGEDVMADYVASLRMSALVMDYDHNAPGAEHLLATHERFFLKVREKNPDLPVIFMTAPNVTSWYTWQIPRRDAIKRTYDNAVARGDKNVYFIDGAELFGEDGDLCTVDMCHPNSLGHYRMARRVEEELKKALKQGAL